MQMFKAAVSSSWSPGDREADAALPGEVDEQPLRQIAGMSQLGNGVFVCVKIHFPLLNATTTKKICFSHPWARNVFYAN